MKSLDSSLSKTTLLLLVALATQALSAECRAEVGADVLASLAQKSGPAQADSVRRPSWAKEDPDGPGARHFRPPARSLASVKAMAEKLPLGLFGLSADTLLEQTPPASVSAIADVLYFEDFQTNAMANHGIVSYATQSLLTEDELFTSAYRLYAALLNKDGARARSGYAQTPIQERAEFNVYRDLALPAAGGNPYLALKALLIYGHDNMANEINRSGAVGGRLAALDALLPMNNSTLYLDGAIGPTYSAADIAKGRAVAAACNQPGFSAHERYLCNDDKADYQGDYYHVIAAAFLGCRQEVLSKQDSSMLNTMARSSGLLDKGYLASVRQYKIDRFREESDDSTAGSGAVRALIRQEINPLNPVHLQLTEDQLRGLDEHSRRVAQATLDRYSFEIEFRARQHAMGLAFGREACKNVTSIETTSSARATLLAAPAPISDGRDAKTATLPVSTAMLDESQAGKHQHRAQ